MEVIPWICLNPLKSECPLKAAPGHRNSGFPLPSPGVPGSHSSPSGPCELVTDSQNLLKIPPFKNRFHFLLISPGKFKPSLPFRVQC